MTSHIQVDPGPMTVIDKAYLAGLVDGKGCFSFLVLDRRLDPGRRVALFEFTMSFLTSDRPVLEWVKRALGMGEIHEAKNTRKGKVRVYFKVTRRADCVRLAELLHPALLRSKKRHELAVWRDALLVAHALRRGHGSAKVHNDKVFEELRPLSDRLIRLRKFPLTSLP